MTTTRCLSCGQDAADPDRCPDCLEETGGTRHRACCDRDTYGPTGSDQ